MLERLDRANLFLVPLDDQRRWYRYHHLFADLLRSRLLGRARRRSPSCTGAPATGTTRPGSRWRRYGTPWPPVTSTGQPTWSSSRSPSCAGTGRRARCAAGSTSSPRTWSTRRPVLAMGFVGALMASNEFDDVERRLGVIEQLRGEPAVDGSTGGRRIVVVDDGRAGPPARRRRAVPRRPGARRRRPGRRPGACPPGGRPGAPADDDLTRASAGALVGLASLDGRRPRGRPPRLHRRRRRAPPPRVHRRRARLLHHARRPRDHPGPAATGAAHLRARPRARRRRDPRMRGTRDMHTGLGRDRGGTQRPGRRRRAPAARGRARRGGRAAAEPVPVAGRAGARCARPRATAKPRSSCSRRPSGSTSATSRRTCGRSRRMRARMLAAHGDVARGAGVGARARPVAAMTTCPTCASTST